MINYPKNYLGKYPQNYLIIQNVKQRVCQGTCRHREIWYFPRSRLLVSVERQ